jgi:hypothetical protein
LREHPIAGKIIEGRYDRPEDIVRDVIAHRNKSIMDDLYGRLDQGGKNALDAFRLAQRGSREFVRGEPQAAWTRPLTIGTLGLTAPAWAPHVMSAAPWILGGLATEQGVVHALNTPIGRAVVSGSPLAAQRDLANRAVYSALRTGLPQGGLEAYRQSAR